MRHHGPRGISHDFPGPTVILGQVPTGTWQRLVPMAGHAPKDRAHSGGVHAVTGGTAHPTQMLDLADPETTA